MADKDNEEITINGIKYANKEELNKRVKEDAEKLALLIYDIYKEKNAKEKKPKTAGDK